jgi:hypothetical protein
MSTPIMSTRDFIMRLELPEPGPTFESAATIEHEFSSARQAVAVGSQIAEFTETVPSTVRGPIANSLLLAQLAADKATAQSPDVFDWYEKYSQVLRGIGWQVRDVDFATQTVGNTNAAVHKEIIPVLTALLGPQMAAVSIVIGVLQGLQNMEANSPWITLFDRTSRHAAGAKFQVTYVDADAQGQPEITLVCFGITAERTITQVLFFKFSAQRAELKTGTTRLAVSLERLHADKEAIAGRVKTFIAEFVQNIEI